MRRIVSSNKRSNQSVPFRYRLVRIEGGKRFHDTDRLFRSEDELLRAAKSLAVQRRRFDHLHEIRVLDHSVKLMRDDGNGNITWTSEII